MLANDIFVVRHVPATQILIKQGVYFMCRTSLDLAGVTGFVVRTDRCKKRLGG
jgi:hypothetical protein